MREIRPDSLVFHKNGVVIEGDIDMAGFWVDLGPGIGYLQFLRVANCSGTFLSRQLLPAHSPAPCPLVSIPGVLWSRRAAIEADQAIGSYRVGLDRTEGFWLQSDSSVCRHEA